jgi:hypothetical protein
VAVAKHVLLAEVALTASNIKGHQYLVAHLNFGYIGTNFLHYAYKLMPKGGAHAGIGYVAVI